MFILVVSIVVKMWESVSSFYKVGSFCFLRYRFWNGRIVEIRPCVLLGL